MAKKSQESPYLGFNPNEETSPTYRGQVLPDVDLTKGLPQLPDSVKVAKDTLKNIDLTAGLTTVSESTYVQDPFAKLNEGSSFSEVVEAVHYSAVDKYANDFVKEAYNKSVKGTMVQVMSGKKMFDVPLNDNGRLFDMGTQALSLFVPTKENIALAAVGGGLGGKVAQKLGGEKLVKFIGNQMVKNNVMPKRALPSFTENLTRIATTESAYFASFDGLYGGAMNIKEQVLNSDYDLSKFDGLSESERYNLLAKDILKASSFKDFAKGYGIGLTGAVGYGANRYTKRGILGPLMPKSFRGQGVTTKGQGFGIGGEIAGAVLGARIIEPEFKKVIEDIEGGDIALGTAMVGIVAASYIPGNIANIYKTGKVRAGKSTRGMTTEEIAEAREEGVDLAGYTRRRSDVYTRVQDPLIKVEGEIELESKPIFEVDKDGNQQLVGYDTEQSDMAIKRLNSRQLPKGMATGPYMGANIKGNIVLADGSLAGTREIAKDLDVVIDRKSFEATDKGIRFDVKAGRLTYRLDEANSDLFLKFYTSQPGLRKRFEANNKGVFRQKFALTRIRRKTLEGLREDSFSGKNELKKGDWEKAIFNVGGEYDIKKFQNPNKLPSINEMSDIEMRLVTEQFGDLALIKTHEKYIKEEFGSTLENLAGVAGEGVFENIGRSVFGSLQADLSHPVSKTVLKMLGKVDRNVVSRTTNRIVDLQLALGMDTSVLSLKKSIAPVSRMFGYNPFQNKNLEKWIVGEDITLTNGKVIPSGWKEYEKLQAGQLANKDFYAQLARETKKIINKSEKKGGMDRISKEDKIFLERRLKVFKDIKRIMDPLYDDAIKAKIKVAGRQQWYRPSVIKKPIRDAIYTNMLTLDQKVKAITGELSLDKDNALRNLDDTQKEKVQQEMSEWVERLAKSKKPEEQAVSEIWKLTRQNLSKDALDSTVPDYDVWANINATIYNDGFKTYAPLEKSKKFLGSGKDVDVMAAIMKSKSELLDRNLLTLYTDYINGATKTVELNKMFLPKGALFETLIKKIPDSAEMKGVRATVAKVIGSEGGSGSDIPPLVLKERDAIRVIKESITGENAFNRQNIFTKAGFGIAEFEFMTKINLGTAVIPNMTQTFISTLPQLGPMSVVRGLTNYAFNPQVRDMVKRSGVTALNLYDELLGGSRALQRGQARQLANLTTDYSRKTLREYGYREYSQALKDVVAKPFQAINVFNKMIAGAASEDYIIKLTKMLDGEAGIDLNLPGLTKKQRKKYAEAKLRDVFGLDPKQVLKFKESIINRQYNTVAQVKMKQRLMGGMEKYAQDSQMGRNFELDALAFNDQYTKSLLLFKRFPIRQGKYMLNMMKWEVENGNVLNPLQTIASGTFGGAMAATMLDAYKQALSGDRAFYGQREQRNFFEKLNNTIKGQGTGLDLQDGLEYAAAGGMLGTYGEMMANTERLYDTAGFLLKPLILDDLQRVYTTLYGKEYQSGLVEKLFFQEDDPMSIKMRKLAREIGPVMGSGPNNFFKRYHYSPIINPLTNEEIAAYPEGFERAKVASMKQGIVRDINRKLLFSYSDDGNPEIGIEPRKLKSYEGTFQEAREQIATWNSSIYVRRFPTLKIDVDDYTNDDKIMTAYGEFIKENRKYYEVDPDDIALRGMMIDGRLPADATEKQIERFLERQKKKKQKEAEPSIKGILQR